MEDLQVALVALIPRLRRFAVALSGSRATGDDLVQSACLRALERLDQFQPGTRLDSWMFRILRTQWIDHCRGRSRRGTDAAPEELDMISDGGFSARQADDRLELEQVRAAVARLPEDQREVLVLVSIEDCSYREAADILQIPLGTVMSRLARARVRLTQLLEEGVR